MIKDTATIITLLAVGAFVIDRVVNALMFLLSFIHLAPVPELAPNDLGRAKALRWQKLMYYVLAAILAIFMLFAFQGVRLLASLGLGGQIPGERQLDPLLAFIVLVGGAEGFSGLFTGGKTVGAPPPPEPLMVKGTLTLETAGQSAKRAVAD